ncbi:hypothetical protein BIY24_15740 [Halobacteriovorax marinus]|uniref:Membrane protein n=1 Tax=Halobacteriovorax marinus (strain ATCC BAA-682 / DSM 15412 / SJ) TaxID=862908 RepID=E1X107_HALMS|nr:hypothetical protein [Halobacteriovorax marinus]ATH09339.1 hypothetical protein BIY24_15740 [Halobacteriovorax marinus]CBW28077.1 putative membrane protein [Halobacteriovorax marinus SJ]
MIREELYHPMFSHFPIVMFALALITKLIGLSLLKLRPQAANYLLTTAKLLIYISPFLFLITIYLGDFALDQIKNQFCDLFQIYKHEEVAYYALYCFLVVLALEAVSELKHNFKIHMQVGALIFLFCGNYFLFKTAHSGALLVYDLGAAVKVAPKCN